MAVFRSTDFYRSQFSVMEWVEHIHEVWFNNEIIIGLLAMTVHLLPKSKFQPFLSIQDKPVTSWPSWSKFTTSSPAQGWSGPQLDAGLTSSRNAHMYSWATFENKGNLLWLLRHQASWSVFLSMGSSYR